MNSLELNLWKEVRTTELENPESEIEKYIRNIKLTTLMRSYENRWQRPYDKNCNSSDVDW